LALSPAGGAFIGDWLVPLLGIYLGVGILALVINATIGAIILLFNGWGGRWGRRL
jgi:uncharacterized membrane protein YeaQ/YmgE (transglycosylase-associated protein family)